MHISPSPSLPLPSLFSTYCPFLPLSLLPSFLSVSLHFPPPMVPVAGWSVTLLCAQWPVARWWFIAEESGRLGDEVGGWLGLKSLVAVYESVAWWMNSSLCMPITVVFLQCTVGFRYIQRLCRALSSSNHPWPTATHTHTHTHLFLILYLCVLEWRCMEEGGQRNLLKREKRRCWF